MDHSDFDWTEGYVPQSFEYDQRLTDDLNDDYIVDLDETQPPSQPFSQPSQTSYDDPNDTQPRPPSNTTYPTCSFRFIFK